MWKMSYMFETQKKLQLKQKIQRVFAQQQVYGCDHCETNHAMRTILSGESELFHWARLALVGRDFIIQFADSGISTSHADHCVDDCLNVVVVHGQ